MRRSPAAAAPISLLILAEACRREEREPRPDPIAPPNPERDLRLSDLRPGQPNAVPPPSLGQHFEESAWQVGEAKRLFRWFNCIGCHGNGGGGMWPPLMDDAWIYGSSIQNIAASIREGRPNGMPSFNGRIPEQQIWQFATYVRSMPRYVREDVVLGRSDHMQAKPAESSMPCSTPLPTMSCRPLRAAAMRRAALAWPVPAPPRPWRRILRHPRRAGQGRPAHSHATHRRHRAGRTRYRRLSLHATLNGGSREAGPGQNAPLPNEERWRAREDSNS
ncbi:MAG: c-type cytochrome [Acetobacteraceae bacterium]|nr:c-type cytochrome [Acetobacteraceae bacterium]